MKSLNLKKSLVVLSASFVIVSMSGCQAKENKPISSSETHIESSVDKNQDTTSTNNNSSSNSSVVETKEEEIVDYFENLETEVDGYTKESNFDKVKDKAKNAAISGIDFIFYGKEINGVTFESLTDTTKNKIMSIVASIDTKIESKIPGYKETVKDKFGKGYDYVTDKLHQGLNYVDGKLEDKYGEKYDDVKDKASDIKDNVKDKAGDLWDKTKDKAGEGWSKVKDWYENKTNKR